jgi:benzylsuccinate CoA-transferase BbsF subunit
MTKGPLDGVRITDFTWAWAGPYGTLLLAFLGAEVIRIESRKRLDHTRVRSLMSGVTGLDPDRSTHFNDINLNKLSLSLDLTKPTAVEIVKRLVGISDVVTQNMRPGVLDRLGLSYEELRAVKSDIIMLSSSAVGSTGPERTYAGYATTFAAMAGVASITGHPNGRPIPLSGSSDTRVGTTAAFAVLAALLHRRRTGEGQNIDLSSTEAISALVGDVFMDYTMNQRVAQRLANRDQIMAPHNCYPCRGEQWVTIAIGSEDEWRAFCGVVDGSLLVEDPRFADAYSRWQHQEELDQVVSEWTSNRTAYEAAETLQREGVAAVPVFDGYSLVRDAHLQARGMFQELEHPLIGKRLVVTPPWQLSKTPAQVRRSGPLLGEHVDYVLGELLGMSATEIQRLTDEGVIY